jgi:luciferase family oxidoreductase group 1
VFPQQVADLTALFSGKLPQGHYAENVVLQPLIETKPEMWVLGSSDFGGALAAELGIRFAFAHFINPQYGDAVAKMYREHFRPGHEAAPYCAVALFVICADSEAEAEDLAAAVDLRRVQMAYGLNAPIPTVALGRAQRYSEREQAIIESQRPRSIIGTPEQVTGRMLELQEQFAADEIVVLTVAASYEARLRSYQLLAEAFELKP